MPHPEREHELMIEVARLRRENERLDRTLASAFEDLHAEQRRAETAQEALAAARRALRDLLVACTSSPGASATADAVNHARAALAAPAAGEEGTR